MSNTIPSTSVAVIEKVNKPDFIFDPSIRREHAENTVLQSGMMVVGK